MKYSTIFALASALAGYASASDCDYIDGNYYCNEVTKWQYTNVGFSGSYDDITSWDEDTGDTTSVTKSFSGSMAPFDEDLSVHFRGPMHLAEFAVYYPASSSSKKKREVKREDTADCATTQHVHHKHVKRATAVVTRTVYMDANGNTVTTLATEIVDAPGGAGSATTNTAQTTTASTASTATASTVDTDSDTTAASVESSTSSASAGDWSRSSYYKAGDSSDNLVFLNNYGGSGSGVWSSVFGNSLSYANSDNSGAASEATVLDDTTIESNSEFAIFSGTECDSSSSSGNCDYYRDGTVAYEGFSGAEKIFLIRFKMPSDSSSTLYNADMPAIWFLNAKIPRGVQYGASDASCWISGCGELDVFEILSAGSNYLTTCMHDGQGQGSSDYIARPTDDYVTGVVIFYDSQIHVMVVDDYSDFDSVLSSSQVQDWIDVSGTTISLSS